MAGAQTEVPANPPAGPGAPLHVRLKPKQHGGGGGTGFRDGLARLKQPARPQRHLPGGECAAWRTRSGGRERFQSGLGSEHCEGPLPQLVALGRFPDTPLEGAVRQLAPRTENGPGGGYRARRRRRRRGRGARRGARWELSPNPSAFGLGVAAAVARRAALAGAAEPTADIDLHFTVNNMSALGAKTNTLLEKVAAAVDQSAFYSALWGSLLTSPAVRLPGITYVLAHLNRKLSMEDQLYIIGSDIELMVEAVSTSVQDSSVLVQRSTLDLILFCFPFHMSQATRPDMIRILSAALHVVLRRDMSLNRRLYAWLLGFDNNGAIIGPRSTRHSNPEEHATYYFTTFSKELLVQAMVGILHMNGFGEETTLTQDLKPFRILISLLDKPELGPVILEDVLIEVFRTLYSQCKAELDLQMEPPFSKDHAQLSSKLRENKKTAELIKTANLLFNSFEPYYMWDYVARWFEECCRRTMHARLQTGPGDSESSELQLTNFCLL
ncbi:protein dopey-1 [Myotis lucifugus]|uniref:protein dopey-1 n=1 Tax=Myotis lucifugus TaxID=59463 RepID=UPI0006D735AE|nr:protein dopey-1 [Myotis lucifugus]